MDDLTVLISYVAGAALSLGFEYIPGVSTWYEGLSATNKKLVMGGSLILVAVVVFGLSCTSLLSAVTCDVDGLLATGQALFAALLANQSVHALTKRSNSGS